MGNANHLGTFRRPFHRFLLGAAILLAPAIASADAPNAFEQKIKEAQSIAGDRYGPVQQHLCYLHSPEDDARLAARRQKAVLRPTQVFDDFYYVGAEEVASWALKTSGGIVLFDTLDNPQEAKDDIADGLVALGLQPRDIKYIVLTHGHGDHFGGAQYLKDLSGAKIIASVADTAVMKEFANGGPGPSAWRKLVPAVDESITDGEVLTLGQTKITFHITPGHTPGTASSVFEVHDHGRPYTLAFWGGVGVPNQAQPLAQYVQSVDNFSAVAASAGAQIGITNHPHADMTLEWVSEIHDKKPSANPLIVGQTGVAQWFGVIKACAQAQQARLSLGMPPAKRHSATATQ